MTLPLRDYLSLMRPQQYLKNLFIPAPAFFAMTIAKPEVALKLALVMAAFCLVTSAVYVFNDWRDMALDRLHPDKRNRPLAAGSIAVGPALIFMLLLAVSGLCLLWAVAPACLPFVLTYLALNLCYSLWFKALSLIDINIIALGFVLRLFIGAQAVAVPLSRWIIIITYLLALFLALAKRRNDVILSQESGRSMRPSLDGYNLDFLNGAMVLVAGIVMVSYIMYTISPEVTARVHTDRLFFTSFFVLLGFLRYMQLTFVENISGSPTLVALTDRFLQVVILAWVAVFAWLLY